MLRRLAPFLLALVVTILAGAPVASTVASLTVTPTPVASVSEIRVECSPGEALVSTDGSDRMESLACTPDDGVIDEGDPDWRCWSMGNRRCSVLPLSHR